MFWTTKYSIFPPNTWIEPDIVPAGSCCDELIIPLGTLLIPLNVIWDEPLTNAFAAVALPSYLSSYDEVSCDEPLTILLPIVSYEDVADSTLSNLASKDDVVVSILLNLPSIDDVVVSTFVNLSFNEPDSTSNLPALCCKEELTTSICDILSASICSTPDNWVNLVLTEDVSLVPSIDEVNDSKLFNCISVDS